MRSTASTRVWMLVVRRPNRRAIRSQQEEPQGAAARSIELLRDDGQQFDLARCSFPRPRQGSRGTLAEDVCFVSAARSEDIRVALLSREAPPSTVVWVEASHFSDHSERSWRLEDNRTIPGCTWSSIQGASFACRSTQA